MDTQLLIGEKIFDLRLTTRSIIELEKRLGKSPVAPIFDLDKGIMPTIGDMVIIFHQMLVTMNHGITMADAEDLFFKWVADEEGRTYYDFLSVIVSVYQSCGLLGRGESKNQ